MTRPETEIAAPPRAVRAKCERAEDDLRTACALLREAGLAQNADDLMRTVRHLRVWTQADGWLDCIGVPR